MIAIEIGLNYVRSRCFNFHRALAFSSRAVVTQPRFDAVLIQRRLQLYTFSESINRKSSFDLARQSFLPHSIQSVTPYSRHFSFTASMADNKFCIEYATRGTAACKKCKEKIPKETIRIAKITANPFNDDPDAVLKNWHHVKCIFEIFSRARATTKTIEDVEDLPGWDQIKAEDQKPILELIRANAARFAKARDAASKRTPVKKKNAAATSPGASTAGGGHQAATSPLPPAAASSALASTSAAFSDKDRYVTSTDKNHKDNSFRSFRVLVANVADTPGYLDKTNLIQKYVTEGNDGDGFKGDLYLTMKSLLPGVVKRIYNLNSKQIVKLFSRVFGAQEEEMVEDLNKGDVAETVRVFFEASDRFPPAKKSKLNLQDVEDLLTELAGETKEDDQQRVLGKIAKVSTGNDLKMIVRLIKHDLRMQSGAKHVLDALDKSAYEAFQASRNLRDVVARFQAGTLEVASSIMSPVLPMLCEACRSVDMAFKKCPNGMFSEIKYDGERVQVHKNGSEFKYFSRSLKPVLPHKVNLFKDYIPKAFPKADSLILDSEVLLIDTKTSKPLPFGTLGVHKKGAFTDANVCLFVFDCLYFNGTSLMGRPIKERRKFLVENMVEIPNRILFSEMKHVTRQTDLKEMIAKVLTEGLEGLVLKDLNSTYEPGKRHWLKVKKDYLLAGSMADSADLVVLGAYFGTGNKGGMMSIFLMGCYDEATRKFCTVTKCHSGFDDAQLARLQNTLKMIKIDKDKSKLPDWLKINVANVNLIPEFIAEDPFKSPVWEIVGAEFTRAELHTADGISIRFPRVTRERHDKSWKEATSLAQLKTLFETSKEKTDFHSLLGVEKTEGNEEKPLATTSKTTNVDVKAETGRKRSPATTPPPAAPPKITKLTPKKSEKVARDDESFVKEEPKVKLDKGKSPMSKMPLNGNAPSGSPLSDVFTGVKIYFPEDVVDDDVRMLRRYFVAFDGDLLEAHEASEATHKIVDVPDDGAVEYDDSVVRVTADWIWHSVRVGMLIDDAAYRV